MIEVGDDAGRRSPRASVDAVLQYAWDADTFTSNDAMPHVGLTRSTTIEAIDELIAAGLVDELANARVGGDYRKGRPARRFAFRASAAAVVGLDAGRAHLTAIAADLRGRPLARHSVELDPANDTPEGRRSAIAAALEAVIEAAGLDPDAVASVCVGVPAPVDAEGRSPRGHAEFWHRMNPDLGSVLARFAPISRIENDASLAAVAEGATGAAVGSRDYIALLAGDRLGSGVVIDGRLLRGAHGGTGELIAFDHIEGVGSVDGLGLSVAKWAHEAVESGEIGPDRPLARLAQRSPDELTARAVFEAAEAGDPDARALIDKTGQVVARVAAVFGSLFDPERIVVCGAVADSVEVALDAARAVVPTETHLPQPVLIASTLGADVVAIGAVFAAVEAARRGLLSVTASQLVLR